MRRHSLIFLSPDYTLPHLSSLLGTMITMTTTLLQTQSQAAPRLAIKEKHLTGLDPEWSELWHTHGADMVRADELPLEQYRENPSLYSFTYPTYAGEIVPMIIPMVQAYNQAGPDVFHVEDIRVPVTTPSGEVTIRIYSPEGSGPFPVHLNFHGGEWCLTSKSNER